jgi:metallo-beta-lactamase family protein
MKMRFLGAAREVTGSKLLIITKAGKQILMDCGMYQGKGLETDAMNKKLGFNPQHIDYVVLSHAHIDHSGLIPYLYKLGFDGTVVCTNATRDLCTYMLPDSGQIQEHDTLVFNKKMARMGKEGIEPLYTKDDAIDCLKHFIGVPYDLKFQIDSNIRVKFTTTGHMLGGAVINLELKEDDHIVKIAYTGDIGRPSARILGPPVPFPQADIIVAESTYGDRLHQPIQEAEKDLLDVVNYTCVEKKGKLIIPSFSVGRTQEIVYSLNNLYNEGLLPKIDVYIDSPLAFNATEVFRMHPECFNKDILKVMETDPDPFGFNNCFYIRSHEDSKKLNSIEKPCVIISASGMMEAGRIKHHLANNITESKNTILVVGYCSPNTLGAKILRGDPEVSIFGQRLPVRAEVKRIESYSGHGDYKEMIDFLNCQQKEKVKKMYLVHGDYQAQQFYKTQLELAGFEHVGIPEYGDEVEY